MLTIHLKEIQVLEEYTHNLYIDKLVKYFSTVYAPDEIRTWGYKTNEELRKRVLKGIENAITYNFTNEQELFDYLECDFELGDKFVNSAEYPWASAILYDRDGKNRNIRLSESLALQLKLQS